MSTNHAIYGNPELINEKDALMYLPHSIGIEIECGYQEHFTITELSNAVSSIPDLIEFNAPNQWENRFRIPNGKKGLVALYNISNYCKTYLALNNESGIHYHVNAPWVKNINSIQDLNSTVRQFVLDELDSWDYKGNYNARDIRFSSKSAWVNIRSSFKTVEYRLGEMTFDYPLLLKRIIHASKLTDYLKHGFSNLRTNVLKELLEKYKSDLSDLTIDDLNNNNIKTMLKNRYVKI